MHFMYCVQDARQQYEQKIEEVKQQIRNFIHDLELSVRRKVTLDLDEGYLPIEIEDILMRYFPEPDELILEIIFVFLDEEIESLLVQQKNGKVTCVI